jgi:hypothetical protein
MPTEPAIPTLAQVAERASVVCDPSGTDDGVSAIRERLEDRDEPITAVVAISDELTELAREIDPEGDDPAVRMTAAVIVYLAFRRDEVSDERDDILRLAARAEFGTKPPPDMADWLALQGVAA